LPILPLGIPPEKYFYNRKDELKRLKNHLNALNEDIAEQILMTGYRGVGKTSLLKKLINEVPENILVSYVDISRIYGIQKGELTEELILSELLSSMNEAIGKKRIKFTEKVHGKLNQILNGLKLKEYDFREAGTLLGISIPDVKDNYLKLSQFVMQLPQRVVESSKGEIKGFLIVMDEFQLIGELKKPSAFFWMIRSYTQEQSNVSYIFTGSISRTSEIIDMINGPNGAFGGRMIQFNIEPFTREETRGYLTEKVPEITFTDDGFERFYECTRGIPSYINTFCNTLSSGDVYTAGKVKETFFKKMDQITVMWIKIWGTLTPKEKEIVVSLVENGPQTWSSLLESVNFSRASLAKYLDILKNKGIIGLNTEKNYIVDDLLLSNWLKTKREMDGYYPQ
jgi:hypothetical protein